MSDGRPSPFQIWWRDDGLRGNERYVFEKFGLKPIPRQMYHIVQDSCYKCSWLPPDHPKQIKEVFQTRKLKNLSYMELKRDLERFGPLLVSFFGLRGSSYHITVVVGVTQDYVILNDSSASQYTDREGKIAAIPIDEFNNHLNNEDEHPIWYYPSPPWAGCGQVTA